MNTLPDKLGRAPEEPPAYAFRTKVRCPVCKTLKSRATCTRGRVQYRRCINGHIWQEIGVRV